MRAVLLACAIVGLSLQVQAQDAATTASLQAIQQMQQSQANADGGGMSFPPRRGALVSQPQLAAIQPASQFTEFGQYALSQMQSLTAPLQTYSLVLNIPDWSTWKVDTFVHDLAFSVKPGVVKPGTKVRIRWRENGTVYYTTNGWSPNPTSIPYAGPITITGPTHIQAIEVNSVGGYYSSWPSWSRSEILDAYYDVAPGAPSSSPVPGVNPAMVTDGLLHQGTVLKLVTGAKVDSLLAKMGDQVSLLLDQDVMVGDHVAIPKGAPVDAVLVQAVAPDQSHTGGMLIVAVRELHAGEVTIGLHGVETMEGQAGHAAKVAVIEPGMSLQAIVTADVQLKP